MRRTIATLLLALWASGAAVAAPDTTTCTDTVYVGGAAATAGTVKATLSERGSIADGSSTVTVSGRVETTISGAGAYTLALYPNDAITPAWTFWSVEFRVTAPQATGWTELWVVATSPDPTTCATYQRITASPGRQLTNNYVEYVSTEPTGTCTANQKPRISHETNPPKVCICRSGTWDCDSVGGGVGGGSSIVLDLGDSAPNESSGVTEIATTGDTPGIFSEPSADKLLVNVGLAWPTATALSVDPANCSSGTLASGVSASGVAQDCTDIYTQVEGDTHEGSADHDGRYFTETEVQAGACNSTTEKQYGVDTDGSPLCSADVAGGGGTPNVYDLGDDGSNEATDLVEIATINDNAGAAAIFSAPSGTKALIDVSKIWPTAATANAGDSATSFFSVGTLEDARLPIELAYEDEANTFTQTTTISGQIAAANPLNDIRMTSLGKWLTGEDSRNQLALAHLSGTATVSGSGGTLTYTNPSNVFLLGTSTDGAVTTPTGTSDTARITIEDTAGLPAPRYNDSTGYFVSVQQAALGARDLTVEARYSDGAGDTTWRTIASVTGQASRSWVAAATLSSFVSPYTIYGVRVTATNWLTTGSAMYMTSLGLHHLGEALAPAFLPRDGSGRMLGNLNVDNSKQLWFGELDTNGTSKIIVDAPDQITADRTVALIDNASPIAGSNIEVSTLATVPRATESGCVDADNDATCEVSIVAGQLRLDYDDNGVADATLDTSGLIIVCSPATQQCRLEVTEETANPTCGATQNWLAFVDTDGAGGNAGLWKKCAQGTVSDMDTTSAGADAEYLALSLNGALNNERVMVAGAGVAATDGGANGNWTLATASTETGFLADGGVTSIPAGASGKMQVMDDGDLEWTDGAASPGLQSVDSRAASIHASASTITSGTIPAARVGADHIDAITEIAAALKSGADVTLVTGTEGTSGNVVTWNVDGDAVDGGVALTALATLASPTFTGDPVFPAGTIEAGALAAASVDGDDVNANIAGRSLTLNTGTTPDSIDADAELYTKTNCLTIETPADADNLLWFRAETAITVTGIDCLVNAATSAIITVQECDGNGGSCGATEAAITCAVTNTTEATSIDDAAINAGDWVRVDVGPVTGTVGHVAVCMTFTVDE